MRWHNSAAQGRVSQGYRTVGLQRVALDRYERRCVAHCANSPYKAIHSEDVAATDRDWCVLTSHSRHILSPLLLRRDIIRKLADIPNRARCSSMRKDTGAIDQCQVFFFSVGCNSVICTSILISSLFLFIHIINIVYNISVIKLY